MKNGLKIFLKVFIIALLVGSLALGGVVIAVSLGVFGGDSGFDISALDLNFTSMVYYTDSAGEVHELERLYETQNRIWADISTIPKYLQDAFVAIEDERFEYHNGVDLPRTLKASFIYITKGSSSFGGSTITQQLVKNITNDKDTSPARKAREILRAMSMERKFSKQQILELYLNTIFLANNCNGVEAAANKYFDKRASELTLAESASIAGITQFPSRYDPLVNPDKNIEKQRIVLKKMLELGKITQEEYDSAVAEKLNFQNKAINKNTSVQSYFVDQLINDLLRDLQKEKGYSKTFAEQMIYNGGLKIYATIDPFVQNAMEEVYKNPNNFPKVSGDVTPQSAMVVLDPQTGAIKGTVGGIGEKKADRVLNRASQSLRQPGSTIKPIGVYAPAIELGLISPASIVVDAPIDIDGWKPVNYYSGYKGNVTVRHALEQSMNTPAIRVLQNVGTDYSFEFLTKKLGITSLVSSETRQDGKTYSDKNLSSLALGGLTDGISATELAAAYAPFANNGIYCKPYSYTKVVNSDGKLILENKVKSVVAMSETTAFLVNSMLNSVIARGTGTAARLSTNMPAGGKTGTTDDQNDRWFVGYTPYYVGVVWYGYDQPKSLSFLSYHPCMPVWKKVMEKINAPLPVKQFTVPKGIIKASICSETGKLATAECGALIDSEGKSYSTVITEYFKANSVPSSYCPGHKDANWIVPEGTESGGESEGAEPSSESTVTPSTSDSPSDITKPSAISISPSKPPVVTISPPPTPTKSPSTGIIVLD